MPVEERIIGGSSSGDFDPVAPSNVDQLPNEADFQNQRPNGEPFAGAAVEPLNNNTAQAPNGAVIPVPGAPSTNVASAPIDAKFSEEDFYQQGFELLKQSEHDQAVAIFQEQIASYPQGELVDDAYYWIAESKYVNRDLDGSKLNFRTIVDRYKQSPRLPDAMLKIAYIEQEQGNAIEARILLQEIIQFYPRSNAAISAKNRLSEL